MSEIDCGFDTDGRWFRVRAGAVILDAGRVLMARNTRDGYLYSVGGGVHHGETTAEAAHREVLEETGVDMEIDRLLFVHENFFTDSSSPAIAERDCHELTFYYLMRYRPGMPLRSGSRTNDGLDEWLEWVPLDTYGRETLAYPTFFATELRELPLTPRVITTRE